MGDPRRAGQVKDRVSQGLGLRVSPAAPRGARRAPGPRAPSMPARLSASPSTWTVSAPRRRIGPISPGSRLPRTAVRVGSGLSAWGWS